jgi:hypothetical protein
MEWSTYGHGVWGEVFGNDRPCTYGGVVTYVYTTYNDSPCPKIYIVTYDW